LALDLFVELLALVFVLVRLNFGLRSMQLLLDF
jgi:hypothetical protein